MSKPRRVAALFCATLSVAASLNGNDGLVMKVSPAVSRAPALLKVQVTVEPSADNRSLQITAESRDFFRSSEVQIDGRNTSPLNVFEFRNLPTGMYQVTGVLIGTHGPRATVLRLAKVEPAVGSVR